MIGVCIGVPSIGKKCHRIKVAHSRRSFGKFRWLCDHCKKLRKELSCVPVKKKKRNRLEE